MIDWTRTRAFTATPTSNGIHIVVQRDGDPHGVAPGEYEGFRRQLIRDLESIRDPASGERIVTRVWTRDEAYAGPHEKSGPDLTLALRDGGLVSILPSDEILRRRSQIAGSHRPQGIFAARGPAIRRGACGSEISLLDVAPTAMYLLGLPLHEEFQGRLPQELVAPEWWQAHRPERSQYQESAAAAAGGEAVATTPEDEQVVLERLRELGYVD